MRGGLQAAAGGDRDAAQRLAVGEGVRQVRPGLGLASLDGGAGGPRGGERGAAPAARQREHASEGGGGGGGGGGEARGGAARTRLPGAGAGPRRPRGAF